MKYKNIFFDLDRTLWDFESNSIETIKEIFYKYNLNELCEFDIFHKTYRKVNEKMWAKYRDNQVSKEQLSWLRFYRTMTYFDKTDEQTARLMSKDYISISPTKTVMFDYSIEILDYLKSKGYNLYIITNGFKEVQYIKLENSGLKPFFDMVFTSEEVGCNKPNSAYFSHVLRETSSNPEDSIVIGDDIEVDIKGAAKLDIDTIWFNSIERLTDFNPTYEVNNLQEIESIL